MQNKEINTKLTPQQEAAITYRGGSLLVSSAAGSGKTMVLVERLLGYIDEGHNIDEFLVITYTRAAALELRERIYERLQQRLAESPGNYHIRRQTMLCRGAHIDTIHAFCGALLRENAHLAMLPPDFRVADENECEIIKIEALENVFNRTYEELDEHKDKKISIGMLVEGRDDKQLLEIVQDIFNRLRGLPDPEGWIRIQIDGAVCEKDIKDISETKSGRYLMEELRDRANHCLAKMLELREKMRFYEEFESRWAQSVDETIVSIAALVNAIDKNWDETVKHAKILFPTPKPISGYDELKEIRKWCKAEIGKITKYLEMGSDDHIKDMKTISHVTSMILKLVLDFDAAYCEGKRKHGVVDFSDLEHMTLSLLRDKGTGKKTAIARAISERFEEILVDEYQDVNEVQEMLFDALSNEGNNIFMVGDVKQSVYRFRLAEPSIFLEKYRAFDEFEPDKRALTGKSGKEKYNKPVKINLSMNFRSSAGILETANHVFRSIMSLRLGEMEYTDAEALIPGRISEKGKQGKQGIDKENEYRISDGIYEIPDDEQKMNNVPVEIDFITTETIPESEEDEPSSVELEARYVAQRIKKLIDTKYMIEENDESLRPVRYSDIAILLRSVKGVSWRYARALSNLSIPSDMSNSESYFDTIEVQAALSLLSVIDNPMQDIPLAALLCGPIYKFTTDELAEIRVPEINTSYYDALIQSAEHKEVSSETSCKCKRVLDEIEEFRNIAYDYKIDRFILSVFNRTGLLKEVTAMTGGEKRKNNLLAMVEFARLFEKNGFRGLFDFLNNIRSLQERGIDITDSMGSKYSGAADNNAVRILSIHKSKGLEFPVVFLANTSKKHNLTDLNKSFIFHKDMGIGGIIRDADRRTKYPTLARSAIKEKLRSEMLSEEIRVLYVAMTRARDKLVITAAFNDAKKRKDKINFLADASGKVMPQALLSLSSVADWLIAGTRNIPGEYASINYVELEDDMSGFADSICSVPASLAVEKQMTLQSKKADESTVLPTKVFDFKYPFETATRLPSKLTVTGLKKIADPEAESAAWIRTEYAAQSIRSRKPCFVREEEKMTGAQRGTLLHEIMRYIDYNKCSTESDVRKDLQRIVKMGLLDEKEIAKIDTDLIKIVSLFKTDLGKRIMNAKTLKKEFRFSLLTFAEKYFPGGGNEQILLQGIVDCYFEENEEIVLVDFKTDNVKGDRLTERAKKYAPQLEGYSEALERITGKRVKERLVYFFEAATVVNV